MSKIFGIHFGMHDDAGRLHQWVPGDVVPGWAADRVGDHCLQGAESAVEEAAIYEPAAADDPVQAIGSAPDFTKPAAKRGRPAKA